MNLTVGQTVGVGIKFERWLGIIPWPQITEDLGVWINHSSDPNAELQWVSYNATWEIVTISPIRKGEEITIDYAETPIYIEGPLPHYR